MKSLIALDWGTTSLRGARFENGEVADERSFARGILSVAAGGFRELFDTLFGDWMETPETLCLIAGMAGSQQGWVEAPYCDCPASLADVVARLRWVEPGRIGIVPGLVCIHDGVPDVMRGEETQIFGALRLLGIDSGRFVLPGTHCKWVQVENGRIESFATVMTGEFYALLRRHSILARTLPGDDAELDGPTFDAGIAHALRGSSLMQTAFSVRTLSLFERLPMLKRPSYLSGLVIGEELRSQGVDGVSDLIVIGSPTLTERYERALTTLGVRVTCIGSGATWQGLAAVASLAPHSAG